MAIVAANGQDPNQQGNTQSNMGGSGTITSGGGASGGGGGGSAYQAPAAPGTTAAPNIQAYMNANQGAGQRLSSAISGNVQNQANQVQQGINTSQQNLNNMYQPLNQQLSGGQQAANTAFQNPTDLLNAYQASQAGSTTTPNQQNLNAYNAFQGDVAGTSQYNQQQQQLQNYNQAGQQAANTIQPQLGNLQQTAGMAANQMGQNQLLQNAVGTPNYSTGQQALDSLFLQGQGNQLQQNLNNISGQTAQQATNANTDYQNKLAALQQLSGQNTAYAQNLFENGPGTAANAPQGQGLNQIAQTAQQQYNQLASQVPAEQQAALAGQLTTQQMQALGITPGSQSWGVNLNNYLSANPLLAANAGGLAQAATPAELARYNALNQLAGGPAGTAQQSVFGTATTAGNYQPVQFNAQGFQNAVSQAQQAQQGDYQADISQLNSLMNPAASGGKGFQVPSYVAQNWAPVTSLLNSGTATPQQIASAIQGQLTNFDQNFNPISAQQANTAFMPILNNIQQYIAASNAAVTPDNGPTTVGGRGAIYKPGV